MDPQIWASLIRRHPKWFAAFQMLVVIGLPTGAYFLYDYMDDITEPKAVFSILSGVFAFLFALIILLIKLVLDRIWVDKIIYAAHESEINTDDLLKFIEDAGGLQYSSNGLWKEFSLGLMRKRIANTRTFLNNLKIGHIHIDGEDSKHLISLTENSKQSILATSLASVDTGFWQGLTASAYMDQLFLAVSRGCVVRRIFVGSPDEIEAIKKIATHQASRGIDVKIFSFGDYESVRDFIIFDNDVFYTINCIQGRGRISATDIYSSADPQLSESRSKFDRIWHQATPIEEYWPNSHSKNPVSGMVQS